MSDRMGITSNVMSMDAIIMVSPGALPAVKPIQHAFELMDLEADQYQFVIGKELLRVLFPDHLPSSYYSKVTMASTVPSLCGVMVNVMQQLVENATGNTVDDSQLLDEMVNTSVGSVPAEDVQERASVYTPSELEDEYGTARDVIMNDPDVTAAIEMNERIGGFCSLPESVVHLDVDPDFVRTGYRKQYNVPQAAHQAVTEQVEKWLAAGKITLAPLDCPYNSSLVVANKKDAYGTFTGYRICLDTRPLNKAIMLTSADRFPMPYLRDVLEKFRGCQYFGEIDLSEAYLQFQLDDESRPYTAFTWNSRQYMFVGCPFGIFTLPSRFQRVMCNTFNDLVFTCPYLDNLPFGSETIEEHKKHLLLVVNRCNEHNLKIKMKDLKVCHAEMRCLGHLLTHDGVALSPSKLEFVQNYERPVTGKQLQSFLGTVTFLRPNVRHLSEITASLEAAKFHNGDIGMD